MNAIILSIGDELVSGQTVNTNATWLSQQLAQLGIAVASHITVGDDLAAIVTAIQTAAAQTDLLLISGGLGPTEDDLTRQALATALNDTLVLDPAALATVRAFFQSINRPMSASNESQAYRPASATCLPNRHGTAPGLRARLSTADIFVVPGVPREMKGMFADTIAPALAPRAGNTVLRIAKLSTFGMGESVVGEKIKDLMQRGGNPSVGTTVADGIVSVRIYATGTPADADAMIQTTTTLVQDRLGPIIFGHNDTTLEAAIMALLLDKKLTIATAESCTGGLLGALLTEIPGSSAAFLRGWVTYTNAAKQEDLNVPENLLSQYGAVSSQVAVAMAEGARRRAKTDLAISITGIAGPAGGTPEKPVGLVYIALAHAAGTAVKRTIFPGGRSQIRLRAAQMALALTRWHLIGLDPLTVLA